MIIIDIPYAPSRHGEWSVSVSNDGHSEFKSRMDALRFAISAALRAQQRGNDTLITVEGVDGQWRMFDHLAKGVV
ncbi:hypothetical protein [Dyella sp. S184]|uniref:hypothetical protein n=1 Tax=Dyella sp. S184 TaxID=1641862 RepID=UPI00131D43A0|nr:hypothetical protein [Dyella sp. S184]